MTEGPDPDRDDDDLTAAEYVLGVLSDEERSTVARRIEVDRGFARLVESWEARLMPLAEDYRPVAPPASIRAAVNARLFPEADRLSARKWLDSLALWRGVAAAALAALVLVVAAPLIWQPREPATPVQQLAAALQPTDSEVSYLALYDASHRQMTLSHISGERDQDRDFELWLIEGDKPPRSLGVIPVGSTVHLPLSDDIRQNLTAEVVLAISVEPKGGSPTGAPTGPVVAVGDTRLM